MRLTQRRLRGWCDMWVRDDVCRQWKKLPHRCHRGRVTFWITSPDDPHVREFVFTPEGRSDPSGDGRSNGLIRVANVLMGGNV